MVVLPPSSPSVRVYQRPANLMLNEYGVEPVMMVGEMFLISMKRSTELALNQLATSAMDSVVLAKVISVLMARADRPKPVMPKRPTALEPLAYRFWSKVLVMVCCIPWTASTICVVPMAPAVSLIQNEVSVPKTYTPLLGEADSPPGGATGRLTLTKRQSEVACHSPMSAPN